MTDTKSNKIDIPLYGSSYLPKDGWIQSCAKCDTFTSNYIIYNPRESNNDTHIYHLHLCMSCQKNVDTHHDFINEIEKYICTNYNL
jgi:hypothetical protein